MPIAVLEAYKTLTIEAQHEVEQFINFLSSKQNNTQKNNCIIMGLAEGKYKIPDDINAYDDEIANMFGGCL